MAIVCNCPAKCEIHPKYPKEHPGPALVSSAAVAPDIDFSDKLTLKTLEAEWLKAQITMERQRLTLMQQAQTALTALEQFSAAMYEKHGLLQKDWQLDLTKLEFVKREK